MARLAPSASSSTSSEGAMEQDMAAEVESAAAAAAVPTPSGCGGGRGSSSATVAMEKDGAYSVAADVARSTAGAAAAAAAKAVDEEELRQEVGACTQFWAPVLPARQAHAPLRRSQRGVPTVLAGPAAICSCCCGCGCGCRCIWRLPEGGALPAGRARSAQRQPARLPACHPPPPPAAGGRPAQVCGAELHCGCQGGEEAQPAPQGAHLHPPAPTGTCTEHLHPPTPPHPAVPPRLLCDPP